MNRPLFAPFFRHRHPSIAIRFRPSSRPCLVPLHSPLFSPPRLIKSLF
jgi:hypothetical protein